MYRQYGIKKRKYSTEDEVTGSGVKHIFKPQHHN